MRNQSEFLKRLENDLKIEIDHINVSDWVKRDIPAEIKQIRKLGGLFEDYVEILRMETIRNYCNANKIQKVILPEIAEVLASRALNLLCKSRGSELTTNCGQKFQIEDIKLGRPLFEINRRELLFFARKNGLFKYVINDSRTFEKNIQKVVTQKEFKKIIAEGSIGLLLDEFVNDLQGEYRSTCATLLKTVQKLDFSELENVCGSCSARYDPQTDLASLVGKKRDKGQEKLCSACLIMFDQLNY